jgi:murein DD-endopeptidase MepM/ murein hydrolase activator NlpD
VTVYTPVQVEPGGKFNLGVWKGGPFAPDDTVERYVTSRFGAWEPFRKQLGYGPHKGIDLHAGMRTPIHAMGSGQVEVAGVSGFFTAAGIFVQLQHDDNIETRYVHLDEAVVQVGDTVLRGQLIGYSGMTGTSVPHLHLNVRRGLEDLDPVEFFTGQAQPPELDQETLTEYLISQYYLNGATYGGTKAMAAPEYVEIDNKVEAWLIRFQRPVAERPE